jgi:hypothetical protein
MSNIYELPVPTGHIVSGKAPPEIWETRKKSQVVPVTAGGLGTSYHHFLTDEMHNWFVQMGRTYRLKRNWAADPYVTIAIKSKRTAMLYKLTWHGR